MSIKGRIARSRGMSRSVWQSACKSGNNVRHALIV